MGVADEPSSLSAAGDANDTRNADDQGHNDQDGDQIGHEGGVAGINASVVCRFLVGSNTLQAGRAARALGTVIDALEAGLAAEVAEVAVITGGAGGGVAAFGAV